MLLAWVAVLAGLALLVWSAERFVAGSASVARRLGMPPLLIGMVIVGFGTSAPEMVVSGLAAGQGNPGIALGNAYGSNIANIALILGLTALIRPITVQSRVLRRELPLLTAVTVLAAWQLVDERLSRTDAVVLLMVFAGVMGWTIHQGMRRPSDALAAEVAVEMQERTLPLARAILWLGIGLILLLASSRLLVWGAVTMARGLGVNDWLIGLTIVAVGTSLPELAASVVASRRGDADIALGNVLGSNLFNTLAVVGLAGAIHPMEVAPEIFYRDVLMMTVLTLSLFFIGYRYGRAGRINRVEAGFLLLSYAGYSGYLALTCRPPV